VRRDWWGALAAVGRGELYRAFRGNSAGRDPVPGTLWGQRIAKEGGAATPFETKYFDVLVRTNEEWKVAYRMWSDSR
jgi:hypothetical protein